VVTGNSPNEKFWVESISNELKPFAGRVTFTWLNELSFEDMLKRVAALPPRSVILFIYLSVDAAGVSLEGENVVNRLHAVANAPIFSWIDLDFGQGIVGGPLVPLVDVARQVSRVAERILRGEVPSKIGIQPVGFGTPKYDWRELQRWDISESRLPLGSEIHFRDSTVWERYRAYILLICGVILAQAASIGWLIYERRHRRLAEVVARNSLSELTHMNRIATAGELSASLAHEINQPLTGIVTSANAARRWLARESPDIDEARAALDQIEAAGHRASDIVTSVRSMFRKETADKSAVDINKLIWNVLGLVYFDLRKDEIDLQSRLDDQIPPVLGNEVQLQQVILNLIMNAIDSMRSVQPRVLSITSKLSEPDRVEVSIEDTGTGIDPANLAQIFKPLFTTKERGMGMGLSICHSIIEGHGGRIWVEPGPGRGSIFRVSLPKNDPTMA
jgi:signal transduction histidine kinase